MEGENVLSDCVCLTSSFTTTLLVLFAAIALLSIGSGIGSEMMREEQKAIAACCASGTRRTKLSRHPQEWRKRPLRVDSKNASHRTTQGDTGV